MSAGTYQPIVPWDLEAFRSGALPYLESASFAGKIGTPSTIDANGRLAEAGTTFGQAFAILAKDAANLASAGSPIMAYAIRPDVIFEVTLNEAFALTQIGKSYGLVKDATTKAWYLSTADIGNQMTIVAQHPATAVGDTKMRVLARFNPAAIQSLPYNQAPVNILSASGAVTPNTAATYIITKAGVAAMTLAAPTAGVDDGKIITFTSSTANAHTVTATGLFKTGTATVNLATFAAFAGAGFSVMAYGGLWYVMTNTAVTLS